VIEGTAHDEISAAPPCVLQRAEGEGPMAAIATVARRLDLPVTLDDMRRLGLAEATHDMAGVLLAALQVGLRALPVEGSYEELEGQELPAIVVMRSVASGKSGLGERFVVLHRVDAREALVADPSRGITTLSREDFCRDWTGDVILLQRDEPALEEFRGELRRVSRSRLVLAAGVAAASGLSLMAWLASARRGAALSVALAATAVCAVGSLHSALFQSRCPSCNRAAALVGGLPLAWLGLVLHAGILAAAIAVPGPLPFAWGLSFAAGAHVVLLGVLARHRVTCWPCAVTGGGALVGWLAALVAIDLTALRLWPVGVAVVTAGAIAGLLEPARRLSRLRLDAGLMRLVQKVRRESAPAAGMARLLFYKRRGCASCAVFDAALRPVLAETFGERLQIEVRSASGLYLPAPTVVVLGEVSSMLSGLPDTDDPLQPYAAMVELALGSRRPEALGGGAIMLCQPP
jgi:hypothetical protein